MKKALLLFFVLAIIHAEAQTQRGQQRNLPIREGGQTIDAGQIPEKMHTGSGHDGNDHQNDTRRIADLKKLADELVNAVTFDDIVWQKKDAKLTKVDAGNALNARATDPEDADGDGYGDVVQKGVNPLHEGSEAAGENPLFQEGTQNPGNDGSSTPPVQQATGDLKELYPPGNKGNGSRFSSFDEIEFFAWQNLSGETAHGNYAIEITKVGTDGQAQHTFVGTSLSKTGRNPQTGKEIKMRTVKVAKFKAGQALADLVKRTGNPNQEGPAGASTSGRYYWIVRETTTGISSKPSYFSISEEKNNQTGYDEKSAMLIVKIDETALRNTNTSIDNSKDAQTLKSDKRLDIRALRANDARHGLGARHHDARIKDAKATDARIKDVRMSDVRKNELRATTKVDERHQGLIRNRTEPTNKPIEITEESFKIAPQHGLDTKYARIQNGQTVQISKSNVQLIAPFLPNPHGSTINYRWIVRNKKQNNEASFQGTSIQYQFEDEGVYEIEITPVVEQKSLDSYHVTLICI